MRIVHKCEKGLASSTVYYDTVNQNWFYEYGSDYIGPIIQYCPLCGKYLTPMRVREE